MGAVTYRKAMILIDMIEKHCISKKSFEVCNQHQAYGSNIITFHFNSSRNTVCQGEIEIP